MYSPSPMDTLIPNMLADDLDLPNKLAYDLLNGKGMNFYNSESTGSDFNQFGDDATSRRNHVPY
jgi:hypothetical protein